MEQTIQDAIEYSRAGKRQEALDLFDALLADPANKSAVLGHRAWLHFCSGNYALALADYEALAAMGIESDADMQLIMAECLTELGRTGEATDILAREIKRDATNPKLFHLLFKIQNTTIDRTNYLSNITGFSPNVMSNTLAACGQYVPAPINQHLGLMLYSLARNLMPKYAIEIGSYVGASAIYLAQALKDNGQGHLYCFDLFDQSLPDFTGRQRNQLDTFGEHLLAAGLSDRVTAFAGDSSQKLDEMDLKVPPEASGMIFIDGDHTLQGVIRDFNAIRRWINPNTLILLHDVNYRHCRWLGPAQLAKKLYGDANYSLLAIPTVDQTDLVIIQARESRHVKAVVPTFRDVALHKFYTLGHRLRRWFSHR